MRRVLFLLFIFLTNFSNAMTALEQRKLITDRASWALSAYNNPNVCDEWKKAFDKHLNKETKLNPDRIELALAQLTKTWEDLYSAESTSPAHYELLYLSMLKTEEKTKRGSFKAFYDLKFQEHISGAEKILKQYPSDEPALAVDIATAEENLRLAKLLKNYALEKDKAIDLDKAAWFLAVDRASLDNPTNATELNSVAGALVGFRMLVKDKCKDSTVREPKVPSDPKHSNEEPEIRRALPVDGDTPL